MATGVNFGQVVASRACAATLQILADEDKRGRIMGVYTFIAIGIVPFTNLIAGAAANKIIITLTMFIIAGIGFFTALVYLFILPKFRQQLQPIYQQKNLRDLNQPI